MKKVFLIILAASLLLFNTSYAQAPVTMEVDIGNGLFSVSYTHLRAPRDRTRSRMPSSA